MAKKRADQLLVEQGLCSSRSIAQAMVLAGQAYLGTERIDKPGQPLPDDAQLSLRSGPRFVSRGGEKLEGAIEDLAIEADGRICVDIGASTGGFTDCLLQRGAARVYAVDVGRGLLADRLRRDPRVIRREGENARHLRRSSFPETIDLVTVDASFIGLAKLLPAIGAVLQAGGQLLAMVKPQFEAGRQLATRHRGVIRDAQLRAGIVERVAAEVVAEGFELIGQRDCRIRGPKGNLEHFLWARATARSVRAAAEDAKAEGATGGVECPE